MLLSRQSICEPKTATGYHKPYHKAACIFCCSIASTIHLKNNANDWVAADEATDNIIVTRAPQKKGFEMYHKKADGVDGTVFLISKLFRFIANTYSSTNLQPKPLLLNTNNCCYILQYEVIESSDLLV